MPTGRSRPEAITVAKARFVIGPKARRQEARGRRTGTRRAAPAPAAKATPAAANTIHVSVPEDGAGVGEGADDGESDGIGP
jgi:hypothetical protein